MMGSRGALVIDISALVLIIIVVVAMIRQKKFALQMTFLLLAFGGHADLSQYGGYGDPRDTAECQHTVFRRGI